MRRRELTAIFALALVFRIVFVLEWQKLLYASYPLLDAHSYDLWARAIAEGNWLRGAAFYQSPLYAYYLALIYKVAGPDPRLVMWSQCVLGAATCALLARIAGNAFGRVAGLGTGVLAAGNRTLIFYVAPLMKETLGLFLLGIFLSLSLTVRASSTRGFRAGFFLGGAALVRNNVLALPLAWLNSVKSAPRQRTKIIVFLFGVGLALSPAVIHNFLASHEFISVTYGGGFNFYIGHSESAINSAYPEGVSTDPTQEESDVVRLAEAESGKPLTPSEVSRYWLGKGLRFAWTHPFAELVLLANKLFYFFNDREIADDYDVEFISSQFRTVLSLPSVGFGLLVVLATFGIALPWRGSERAIAKRLLAFALVYTISVVAFYVTDRYRLPVLIFLLPLAGLGIAKLREILRARQWRDLGVSALAATPFCVLAFWPLDRDLARSLAYNWGTYAGLASDAQADEISIDAFAKARAASPRWTPAQAYIKASTAYERQNNIAMAEQLLAQACELNPTEGLAFFNYGRFKFEHGDNDGALKLYERSLTVGPWLHQAYIGLALLHLRQGRRGEARAAVEAGLKLKSDNPQLLILREKIR